MVRQNGLPTYGVCLDELTDGAIVTIAAISLTGLGAITWIYVADSG